MAGRPCGFEPRPRHLPSRDAMDDVFIARQPILDHKNRTFGYELLFRSGLDNVYGGGDPDAASSHVIADSLGVMGLGTLTGGRRAFINVTRNILLRGYVEMLPSSAVIVELLEDIVADAEVLEACEQLRAKGFMIALDDVVCAEQLAPLLPLADLVKVDFLGADAPARRAIVRQVAGRRVRLLAEKVETPDAHRQALAEGFSLFQGFYFSRPVVVAGRDLPGYKANYLRVLQEVVRPELDLEGLGEIVEREMGLSYKLLRYVNSAGFGLRSTVRSVPHALMMLGQAGARMWASLMLVTALAREKPEELVLEAAVRAKLCESLAHAAGLERRAEDLFMVGLFSLVDAVLDRPMAVALEDLPLADDARAALLGADNPLGRVHACAVAQLRGDWPRVSVLAGALGVEEAILPGLGLAALRWAQEGFAER